MTLFQTEETLKGIWNFQNLETLNSVSRAYFQRWTITRVKNKTYLHIKTRSILESPAKRLWNHQICAVQAK